MADFIARRLETLRETEPIAGIKIRMWAGAGLSASHARLAPNVVMPAHHHVAEQMGVVLEGSMTITAGGRSESVTAGSIYRIGSDIPHGVTVGPQGCTIIEMFSPAREGAARLGE